MIAKGAYGSVYKIQNNEDYVVKLCDMPDKEIDRCVLHDIFSEVCCMEEVQVDNHIVDLVEYGVSKDQYYIVMRKSMINLKQWRLKIAEIGWNQKVLDISLEIYSIIINSVARLHSNKIVHYDIKCDNILVDQDPLVDLDEIISTGEVFKIIPKIKLVDFGECRMFQTEDDEFCTRSRGTDYIKSPEMLLISRTKDLES